MPTLEAAVSEAERIAADNRHGYSQPNRDGIDYDCSSLVCRTLRNAGFAMPSYNFSTRSMGQWLQMHGWTWHAGLAGVRRGDVLWKTGHTAFATSPTWCVEAFMSEARGIHGRSGDQTGWEIRTAPINYTNWAGYWRYNAPAEVEDEVTPQDIEKIAQRVWSIQQGRETHDRCYRMTSMLKAMCGIGPDDVIDPKAIAGEIYKRTIDRWARCTAMLKGLCGIPKESAAIEDVPETVQVKLSDDDMDELVRRVTAAMKED